MIEFFLTSLFVMLICVIVFGLCCKHHAKDEGATISIIGVLSGICAGCSGALISLQLVIQWIAEAVK
jgi:hypothetical protein